MKRLLDPRLFVTISLIVAGCGTPSEEVAAVASKEQGNLPEALARLDTVLETKAPFIHARLAEPASDEDIADLRKRLGGVEVQCLELWYKWHNGCLDNVTDVLPLGRMLSVAESLADRDAIQNISFVDSKRKRALKMLEDAAGDGFFLDVTTSSPRVFYHMLEDPFPADYGTLEEFVGFITDVHSAGVASTNEDGMVDFDMEKYDRIESDYLSNLTGP